MKRNLMNELTEGIGVLGQLRKYQEELEKIEQILGKALGYPYYKDDPKNFPTATEADGVCVGDHTPWSLAMYAADKIRELEGKLKNTTTLEIKIVDNIFCNKTNKKSHITEGCKCSACGISQWEVLEYSENHTAIL